MIGGLEWIVVIVAVLIFFLFGSEKIPDLARSLGEAKKEYNEAKQETSGVKKELEG